MFNLSLPQLSAAVDEELGQRELCLYKDMTTSELQVMGKRREKNGRLVIKEMENDNKL